jgi:RNA polymerase sigma-70 factor (ECF subfamily)
MASLTASPSIDSERLAALAAKGDSGALGQLYEHWSDKVYRWVLVRANGVHQFTEDVCSDVWLKVARSIRAYTRRDGTSGFSGWLFDIARSCVVDSARAMTRRRREVPTGDMLAQPHAVADGPGDLDTELAGPLADALTKINPRRAQVISLRFYVGMSIEETASHLGTNPGVIRSLQCRALKDLKQHLGTVLVAESQSPDVQPLSQQGSTKKNQNQRGVPA